MEKIISGKVREIYSVSEDRLAIVTTDRISAFDVILPTPIPQKGQVLNRLSSFWFSYTQDIVPNHMISEDLSQMPAELQGPEFEGRTILVKKLRMLPFEFIVRRYLFGSMWKEYQKTGGYCGMKLPEGMKQAEKLPELILTPSIKAEEGHGPDAEQRRHPGGEAGDGAGPEDLGRLPGPLPAVLRLRLRPGHHHRGHQVRVRPGRE